MTHFSGALQISDLDDFIAPSQECIKPVKIQKTGEKLNKIHITDEGDYLQVDDFGQSRPLEKARITLNDCLACSGCITSAETVLVTQQSRQEFYRVLAESNKEASNCSTIIVVSVSPQSAASIAVRYQLSSDDIYGQLAAFFKNLGVDYVFDTTFARNFSLLETGVEFLQRYRQRADDNHALPLLTSACPGWICYAEKTHGSYILPYISTVKSPQQIMGSLVKDYLAKLWDKTPDRIYHVCVMPCFDKKLEASRPDFFNETCQTRDVDCVLSTSEVADMIEEKGINLSDLKPQLCDMRLLSGTDRQYGHDGSGAGGYLEYTLRFAAKELFGSHIDKLTYQIIRNQDFQEVNFNLNGENVLRFALAYGFRNIQNIVQKLKRGKIPYHFVEIMACPSACNNGGGQIRSETPEGSRDLLTKVDELYHSFPVVDPQTEAPVHSLYEQWLGGFGSVKSSQMLRTQYHAVEKTVLNTLKW